jgi:hypothetical protein
MWYGSGNPDKPAEFKPSTTVFFRRSFTIEEIPYKADLYFAAQGISTVFFNGIFLREDTASSFPSNAISINLMKKMRTGLNVLAIKVATSGPSNYGLFPLLLMTVGASVPMPKPPGHEKPISLEAVRIDNYIFPPIKNFSLQQAEASR